jgi:hypothetical protein
MRLSRTGRKAGLFRMMRPQQFEGRAIAPLSSRLVPPHLQVLVHLLPSVIFSVPCSSLGALDFHHHSFLMFHVGPILIIVYRVRECMYKHITVIKSPIVNRT